MAPRVSHRRAIEGLDGAAAAVSNSAKDESHVMASALHREHGKTTRRPGRNSMAYCLRPDESIPAGLRRLARKELKTASDELRSADVPSDDAIHEARKRLKKVRALLQVIEADRGQGLGKASHRLRSINRTLSQLRDADAMLEVLHKLRTRNLHLFDDRTFARVRRRLSAHKRDITETVEHDDAWPEVVKILQKVRRGSRGWRPTHRGFRSLGDGIQRSHERGRKAMKRARQTGQAEDYHEWRKEMKALMYELRLLEECSAGIKRDVAVLNRAETWLGDEHNVAVLCTELSKNASICNGIVDLSRLRLTANRYQCDLRSKAIKSAATIYRRKSTAYVRAMKDAWKAWHEEGT
jgi:CHAD domain-containing protein